MKGRGCPAVWPGSTTIGYGNGFRALLSPEVRAHNRPWTCSAPLQLDASMNPGDSIIVEVVTVEGLSSTDYDTVKIAR